MHVRWGPGGGFMTEPRQGAALQGTVSLAVVIGPSLSLCPGVPVMAKTLYFTSLFRMCFT